MAGRKAVHLNGINPTVHPILPPKQLLKPIQHTKEVPTAALPLMWPHSPRLVPSPDKSDAVTPEETFFLYNKKITWSKTPGHLKKIAQHFLVTLTLLPSATNQSTETASAGQGTPEAVSKEAKTTEAALCLLWKSTRLDQGVAAHRVHTHRPPWCHLLFQGGIL